MDRALGIIPCRAGSKGLPGKHLRRLGSTTLLERALNSAFAARTLSDIVLTSDSQELLDHGAAYARDCNRRIFFVERPPELATDTAGMTPVLQHAAQQFTDDLNLIVCLQPTSPFRTGGDIDDTVQLVRDTGADSAQTLVEAAYRPWPMVHLSGNRTLALFPDAVHRDLRRQDPPGVYQPSGAVYVTRRHVLMEQGRIIGEDHRGLVIPWERSININTPWDFRIAEMVLERNFTP